ncbi:uncharacterized protein TNCV_355921 [Trichonephila clavipes]|nr:uncharacterized protein TNCV_355921 [Trichonephila clavipes]
MEINKEKNLFLLQFFIDKDENASQGAEIVNGVYGADTVTANYVKFWFQRIMFSDEAHFWLNGYVNKQNCRIWSEDNPQVYVETPLHPEKLTVWCDLCAGGILLQKR